MLILLILAPILAIPVLLFLGGALVAVSKKQGTNLGEQRGCTGCFGVLGAAWFVSIGAGVFALAQYVV